MNYTSDEKRKIVKENDNASSYATGLMIFQATNLRHKKNTMVKE